MRAEAFHRDGAVGGMGVAHTAFDALYGNVRRFLPRAPQRRIRGLLNICSRSVYYARVVYHILHVS